MVARAILSPSVGCFRSLNSCLETKPAFRRETPRVPHVALVCVQVEMRDVPAVWIIAPVANLQTRWDWPVSQLPNHARCAIVSIDAIA
jgi:hypothetical protein